MKNKNHMFEFVNDVNDVLWLEKPYLVIYIKSKILYYLSPINNSKW